MKKLLLAVLLVFVIVGLVGIYGDFREVGSSLREFDWRLLPLALLISALSYLARGLRWHLLLSRVSDRSIDVGRNAMLYTASLVGIVTPAKAGEVTRAYYARESFGVPISRTGPVLLSERLMDGVAMVMLAGLGLYLYETRLIVIWFAVVIGLALLVFLMRSPRVLNFVVGVMQKLPGASNEADHKHEFVKTSSDVFSPAALFPSLGLAVVIWGTQALVYFVVILGVGESIELLTLVKALFIYPMAMLIGTISLLPIGLGTTDASLVLLGSGMFDLSRSEVVVAAVVTRAVLILPPVGAGFLASLSPQVRPLLA
jgi:glycosyltransferase 2 family protein